jgi:hypothetical protein
MSLCRTKSLINYFEFRNLSSIVKMSDYKACHVKSWFITFNISIVIVYNEDWAD